MNAPFWSDNPRLSAKSFVTGWICTPNQPLLVFPKSFNCCTIFLALFAGIANPKPILPPVCETIAVLIPITSPSKLNNGPPELPRLIDASVCKNLTYGPLPKSLEIADIIPAVTVPPKPRGFPIAIDQSPTLILSESPQPTYVSFLFFGSIFNTAMSALGSLPSNSAVNSVSSFRITVISSAPSITWLFVTTIPSSLIIKPEPSPVIGRCDRLWSRSKYSLKKSSKGDPSGNCGIWFWLLFSTIVVDAILTTAGDNCSTKSAKLSGTASNGFENKIEIKNKNLILILIVIVFEREINKAKPK